MRTQINIMRNSAGQHSLFSNVVDNCDFNVCSALCFKAAVDYKWNRMRKYVKMDMAIYLISVFIASWATICTAWNIANPWAFTGRFETAEIVVCIVIAVEALLFIAEVTKVYLLGFGHGPTGCDYWNLVKLVASALLTAAGINYLLLVPPLNDGGVIDADWADYDISVKMIQNSLGAVGITLKWIGLLHFLDSFQRFSKTLKMIQAIVSDIVPYVAVYSIIVLALVMFCIANMPGNQAFGSRGTVVEGLFSTFVLAWQISIIGDFEMENYNTIVAKVVFVLFSGFGILIKLNLLIAVMGDSFERVKSDEAAVAMFEQARVILQYECLLVAVGFCDASDSELFPRYMIIAEEVQALKKQVAADGLTGRMRADLNAATEKVTGHMSEEMNEMAKEMREMKSELTAQVAMTSEIQSEMKELKTLLLKNLLSADAK